MQLHFSCFGAWTNWRTQPRKPFITDLDGNLIHMHSPASIVAFNLKPEDEVILHFWNGLPRTSMYLHAKGLLA